MEGSDFYSNREYMLFETYGSNRGGKTQCISDFKDPCLK